MPPATGTSDHESHIEEQIVRAVAEFAWQHSMHWKVTCRHGQANRLLELTHPASSGIILENYVPAAAEGEEAAACYVSLLADNPEFITASAAPSLLHPEFVSGLRAAFKVHDIGDRAAHSLTTLLVEFGHLTSDEADWLARSASRHPPALSDQSDDRNRCVPPAAQTSTSTNIKRDPFHDG